MRLQGKTTMITGASRNIGREIAITFAREGSDLILNTRSSKTELSEVASICEGLGVKTHIVMGDVTDPDKSMQMVQEGINVLGKIDVLVSNVAIRPHKPILEVSNEEWSSVMHTNLFPAFYLIKAVLPGMIDRKSGSIIALGGQAAITGRPETASVTTAKHGLLGLIRAVAAEMAPYKIRANMVNPGTTDTQRLNPEWYPEFEQTDRGSLEHLQGIPLGRQGTVSDIANACLFFASDESSYITGDRLNVVGGKYIV
ncbi:MAG: SDR family oxidoreductase [Chloroflexota bacterium]|nr:SDR family oxidoreductase [Chloroflexota bacterium]